LQHFALIVGGFEFLGDFCLFPFADTIFGFKTKRSERFVVKVEVRQCFPKLLYAELHEPSSLRVPL
jgi:hypothetical protein